MFINKTKLKFNKVKMYFLAIKELGNIITSPVFSLSKTKNINTSKNVGQTLVNLQVKLENWLFVIHFFHLFVINPFDFYSYTLVI